MNQALIAYAKKKGMDELIALIKLCSYRNPNLAFDVPKFGERVVLKSNLYLAARKGDEGFYLGEGLKGSVCIFQKFDHKDQPLVFTYELQQGDEYEFVQK